MTLHLLFFDVIGTAHAVVRRGRIHAGSGSPEGVLMITPDRVVKGLFLIDEPKLMPVQGQAFME